MNSFVGSLRPYASVPFLVAAIALLASLTLGGGTRSGFLADAVLQLISIPVLLVVLWRWHGLGSDDSAGWSTRLAIVICVLVVLLPLLQLVPLPPAIWSRLGGRDLIGPTYEALGRELPWLPLSVTPRGTWLALLSFLPVVAVFLATLQVGFRGRRALCLMIIGFSCFSVVYGMTQVAQGPASPLRLFEFTNPSEAVGLFANRNHYAALLYSALLLMTPWAAAASADLAATSRRKGYPTAVVIAAIASFTIIVMLLSAQAMARSRAGMALALIAILAALLLPLTLTRRGSRDQGTGRVVILGVILALVFAGQYTLGRVLERFDTDAFADARIPYARNTFEAALAFMPFGSGIGSFVSVYGSFEKVGDAGRTFANRAHNDLLEAFLETGALGLVLLALFAAWYISRSISLMRVPVDKSGRLDALLARAAMVVIALLLAHSLADYPLRTGAMAAMFAFCCALMLPPPHAVQAEEEAMALEPVPVVATGRGRSSSQRRRSSTSPTMSREAFAGYKAFDANQGPRPGAGATEGPWPVEPIVSARTPATHPPPGDTPRPPRSNPSDIAWPSTPSDAMATGSVPRAPPTKSGGRWANDTAWPDEWRSASQTDKPDKT